MSDLLPVPYASNLEADGVNSSAEWVALTEGEKTTALSWGRVYLDAEYTCAIPIDDAAPSDNIKLANALLGDYYARGALYPVGGSVDDSGGRSLTAKTITAGSVSISKSYDVTAGAGVVDQYADVTAIMANEGCALVLGGGIGSINLIR